MADTKKAAPKKAVLNVLAEGEEDEYDGNYLPFASDKRSVREQANDHELLAVIAHLNPAVTDEVRTDKFVRAWTPLHWTYEWFDDHEAAEQWVSYARAWAADDIREVGDTTYAVVLVQTGMALKVESVSVHGYKTVKLTDLIRGRFVRWPERLLFGDKNAETNPTVRQEVRTALVKKAQDRKTKAVKGVIERSEKTPTPKARPKRATKAAEAKQEVSKPVIRSAGFRQKLREAKAKAS